METLISPSDALHLCKSASLPALIDVRSPSEFLEGFIPGFCNAPILNDEERHLVGTAYKQQGQAAAFELGYTLTAPHKAERIAQWQALSRRGEAVVCCWRGGARSRLASEWLQTTGVKVLRVRGGYKAMRQVLRSEIEAKKPLLVLAGATGCGKTHLLRELTIPKLDLEAFAHHRGSAFGELGPQPSQTQFENCLGLGLFAETDRLLLEDESRLIGRIEIPPLFKQWMYASPVVVLEATLEERIAITFQEYVIEPLRTKTREEVAAQLQRNLVRISRKLGAQRQREWSLIMRDAFSLPEITLDAHSNWIAPLLRDYYDPLYSYGFARYPRQVLFKGNRHEVVAFLQDMKNRN